MLYVWKPCDFMCKSFSSILCYLFRLGHGRRFRDVELLLTQPHAVVLCCGPVLCRVRGSSSPNLVVNKNSVNYCSSSDKSKRRTKTVKKSLEPKWNQTFMYSPVHRREFRERMLEITLWDQARVREEESEFLGEVSENNHSGVSASFASLVSFSAFLHFFFICRRVLQILIELETALLDDEPHWYKLQTHDVSSIPLPRASPNTQRRQFHGESPTRRLQSMSSSPPPPP